MVRGGVAESSSTVRRPPLRRGGAHRRRDRGADPPRSHRPPGPGRVARRCSRVRNGLLLQVLARDAADHTHVFEFRPRRHADGRALARRAALTRVTAVVLAIDAGTTGVRTVAVDPTAPAVGFAYREFPQHFPRPGWVEHDPDDIWRAVHDTLAEVVAGLDGRHRRRRSASPTSARRSSCGTASTGRPRHRAIVWQDRRTAARCDDLRVAGVEPLVRARTGLVLDPYFSATKLEWLLARGRRRRRRRPRVRHRRLVGAVEPHRCARDRAVEREPHDAVRHRHRRLVRRAARAVRRAALVPARGPPEQWALRRSPIPTRAAGLRGAGVGHRRRPAGRAVRPGVLLRRA